MANAKSSLSDGLCQIFREQAKAWEQERAESAAKDARIWDLEQERQAIHSLVEGQAEDEGLWFMAETAPEAYVQTALRKLHARIEGEAAMELLLGGSVPGGSCARTYRLST